jgi:hypothetical protein
VTVLLDDRLLIAQMTGAQVGLDLDVPPATTNLFLVRLMRSALQGAGRGALLGGWSAQRRGDARPRLLEIRRSTTIVPMADLAWEIAELVERHALSTLGAECLGAARALDAEIWVWERNDGPKIRAAAESEGIGYRTVAL